MIKVIVFSSLPDDVRVIRDALRIYFPKIRLLKSWKKTEDKASGKGQEIFIMSKDRLAVLTEEECPPGKEILLAVDKKDFPEAVKVTLNSAGQTYSQVERLAAETFREEHTNRERRLLRLALHKVLQRALLVEPSPWGILTGVRPTKIVHRLIDEGLSEERIMLHLTRDFAVSFERARLLFGVAAFQHPFLPNKQETPNLVSLYVGIPFCPTRCHYCSFPSFSLEQWGDLLEDYLQGLSREIQVVGALLKDKRVKVQNVYLGGGTPTILSEIQLEKLLKTIEDSFQFIKGRELTVEGGRPDTLTREKLQVLKEHQVTRLSINPQTMSEETLVLIGRQHTVQDILDAYDLAREIGFPAINMDLIIGLPGENSFILQKTLTEVLKLRPENITLHALAMKRAAYYRQEKIKLPLPTEGQAMMDLAHNCLQDAGYFPYYLYRQKDIFAQGENVGYSVPGKACLYNIQMMEERQTILGFGVGSSSKLVNVVDWSLENIYNPKDIVFYLERLEQIMQQKVDKLQAIL
ncbi:MAG: coproporphyrinogen dehydrogenase HemZ [Peptococcia bacterium]|jgi:oxygen-independent coproporphyrinogen-3 oxidase